MADRQFRDIKGPQHAIRILNGVVTIPSGVYATNNLTLSSGSVGFRSVVSGTTAQPGVYTGSLGNLGDPSYKGNECYTSLLGSFFQVDPAATLAPADTVVGGLPRAILLQDKVSTGQFMFGLLNETAAAGQSTGDVTGSLGLPSQDVKVNIMLVVKNSDAI